MRTPTRIPRRHGRLCCCRVEARPSKFTIAVILAAVAFLAFVAGQVYEARNIAADETAAVSELPLPEQTPGPLAGN